MTQENRIRKEEEKKATSKSKKEEQKKEGKKKKAPNANKEQKKGGKQKTSKSKKDEAKVDKKKKAPSGKEEEKQVVIPNEICFNAKNQPTSMITSSHGSADLSICKENDGVHDIITGRASKEAMKHMKHMKNTKNTKEIQKIQERIPKLIRPAASIGSGSTSSPPPPSTEGRTSATTRPGAHSVPGMRSSSPSDETLTAPSVAASTLVSAHLVEEEEDIVFEEVEFKDIELGSVESKSSSAIVVTAVKENPPSSPSLKDFLRNRRVQTFLVLVAVAVITGSIVAATSPKTGQMTTIIVVEEDED